MLFATVDDRRIAGATQMRTSESIAIAIAAWVASAVVMATSFALNERVDMTQIGYKTATVCGGVYAMFLLTSPVNGLLRRSGLKMARLGYAAYLFSIVWPGSIIVLTLLRTVLCPS